MMKNGHRDLSTKYLDFSKIDSGVLHIADNPYSLTEILSDSYHMLEARAKKKGLSVDLNVDKQMPNQLSGDEIAIKQILTNLLTNAVKYTNSGQVTLKITGDIKEDIAVLHCLVKDTGIGIKQEDIGKLYEEFKRIDLSRNRNIEGSGLGMSIVQYFLKLMGSELHIKSEYEKGSEFSFDLRQKIVGTQKIGNIETSKRNYHSFEKGEKVYIPYNDEKVSEKERL